MKKIASHFMALNLFDIVKSVFMFLLTSFADIVYQAIDLAMADKDFQFNWAEMFRISLLATVSYVIKQYFSGTKKTELEDFKPEPLNPKIKP